MTSVTIRGAVLVNMDISGGIKNLRINGVDVVPLVGPNSTAAILTAPRCARPTPTGSATPGTSWSGCGSDLACFTAAVHSESLIRQCFLLAMITPHILLPHGQGRPYQSTSRTLPGRQSPQR